MHPTQNIVTTLPSPTPLRNIGQNPKTEYQSSMLLSTTLHSFLGTLPLTQTFPLASNPELWLSVINTWTWCSRLMQCMSWSQCPNPPWIPRANWLVLCTEQSTHQVGICPWEKYSNSPEACEGQFELDYMLATLVTSHGVTYHIEAQPMSHQLSPCSQTLAL